MRGSRILFVGALVALVLTLVGGCGSEAPPDEILLAPTGARLDDHRWLGEPIRLDNLAVWPVHTDRPLDIGEFVTLEEAERRGVAAVREVGGDVSGGRGSRGQQVVFVDANDAALPVQNEPLPHGDTEAPEGEEDTVAPDAPVEGVEARVGHPRGQVREVAQLVGGGATVNTLVIENRGEVPILVCAGTIVKGGQQDRQIGQDFVIAANATVPVDAFCVEQGRWSVRAGDGLGMAFTNEAQGIAIKTVRASAQYERDQGRVWSEVGKVLQTSSIAGTTSFVAANEELPTEVLERRRKAEARIAAHFASVGTGRAAPVGFAYAVDGRPVTVRTFAHARLLAGQLPAFVKAMVLEAELAARMRPEGVEPAEAAAADVVALIEALKDAEAREERTAAGNWNATRSTTAGFNGACRIRVQGAGPDPRVVVTEDWTAK